MFGILVALGASGMALAAPKVKDPRIAQLILVASYLLLAASLANIFVSIYDSLHQMMLVGGGSLYGRALQAAHVLSYNGVLPALLLGLAWWLPDVGVTWALLVAALGAAACTSLAPRAVDRWMQVAYSAAADRRLCAMARGDSTRHHGAVARGSAALYLVRAERPAYWSLYQMAGMVFSRDDAMVGTSLESQVSPLLPSIRSTTDGVPQPMPHHRFSGYLQAARNRLCRQLERLVQPPIHPSAPMATASPSCIGHCDPAPKPHAADVQ